MDYKTPKEAQDLPGLRLALTTGLPAPWSMTARFMFDVKKIPYVSVEQQGGQPNEDLIAWTGHRNAPVAIYNDEPARTNWADIIDLAERLEPEPRLVPDNAEDRVRMFGLANELAGAAGLTYNARHAMTANLLAAGEGLKEIAERFAKSYGYSEAAAAGAKTRMQQNLTILASQLEDQKAKGSRYFIGDGLTALDLIWASFSNTVRPLPEDKNPMPAHMRAMYEGMGDTIDLPQILLDQRDYIYDTYIELPLTF
jgi:glutathione S-transferase